MNEIVAINKNGDFCILTPLYSRWATDSLGECSFRVIMYAEVEKPIAYVVDCGPEYEKPQVISAELVEAGVELLGPL